jgi:hypothetical protein
MRDGKMRDGEDAGRTKQPRQSAGPKFPQVSQVSKSVVRQIRTLRSVGAGGGQPPPATRWAISDDRPYRDPRLFPWSSRWKKIYRISVWLRTVRREEQSSTLIPGSASRIRGMGVWRIERDASPYAVVTENETLQVLSRDVPSLYALTNPVANILCKCVPGLL